MPPADTDKPQTGGGTVHQTTAAHYTHVGYISLLFLLIFNKYSILFNKIDRRIEF